MATRSYCVELINQAFCTSDMFALSDELMRDLVMLYFRETLPVDDERAQARIGNLKKWVVELVSCAPAQSFMESTFFQVLKMLPKLNGDTLIGLNVFQIVIEEIQASYDTMCDSDRKAVGRILNSRMNLKDVRGNAAFLIHWALIEAVKYFFRNKLSSALPVDQYLNQIDIIVSSTNFFNKLQAQLLISFWSLLDKQLQVRLSSPMSEGDISTETRQRFLMENGNKWQNDLFHLRRKFARLALVVDHPAECWRTSDKKLYTELDPVRLSLKISSNTHSPTRPNLEDSRHDIQLLAASARQLGDINLLRGLDRIYADNELDTCEHLPIMLANLEGHYEDAYEASLKIVSPTDWTLVEFLQSAIELGRCDQFLHQAEKLRSPKLKFLYKQYFDIVLSGKKGPRAGEVKHWLSSWTGLDANTNSTNSQSQPIQTQINLIAPILLAATAMDPTNIELVNETRRMIGLDLITHSLFCLESVNRDHKLFNILLNVITGSDETTALNAQTVGGESIDGPCNHKLYRLAKNLNLNQKFEIVSYRAAKFNFKKGNIDLATRIAQELIDERNSSHETKAMASILMTRYKSTGEKTKLAELCSLASTVSLSNDISPMRKRDIVLDIARAQLKLVDHIDLNELFKDLANLQHKELQFSHSQHSIYAQQIPTMSGQFAPKGDHDKKVIKTLIAISETMYPEISEFTYGTLLLLQIDLLQLIANQSRPFGFAGHGLKCASKILELILNFCDDLDEALVETFVSSFKDTLPIWLNMRRNVISLLVSRKGLTAIWLDALEELLRRLVERYPFLFVYDLLMNLSDSDMRQLARETSGGCDRCDDLCFSKRIWYQVYCILKGLNVNGVDLGDMLLQTRKFVEEMRKISFLPTDLVLKIALRALKTMNRFHRHDSSNDVEPKSRFDYIKSAQIMAKRHIHSLKILLADCRGGATPLDTWFSTNLGPSIGPLYDDLNLVLNEQTSFEETFHAITRCKLALEQCSLKVSQFYEDSKHKLFTKMFSPMLSRLELNNILMPDYNSSCVSRAPVIVKSVSQAITIIHSSTAPKSLKLLGSDGQNRTFLLKSHEDLRLDQAVMEMYASLNLLFQSKKITRNPLCSLRSYSVTPLSSKSGLIRWVEALSLSSILNDWLKSPTSRQIIEGLYKETCKLVCDQTNREEAPGAHERCRPPKGATYLDVFYQVLWAQLGLGADKPTRAKSFRLRSLKPACFAGALRELLLKMSNELVAQQLWLNSYNAHEYWLKTQNFIRSYATASVVGYLIGLGDRHLGNILLDCQNGEIVHVDYNLCFDLAKSSLSPVPERVPFRLTQNIVRAFGYAGLEGGFTSCSRNVLCVLRTHKSILLSHLNCSRLDFMISSNSATLAKNTRTSDSKCRSSGETEAIDSENTRSSATKGTVGNRHDRLEKPSRHKDSLSVQTLIYKNEAKDDIRTPPTLCPAKSRQIFAQIDEKLSGFDGQLFSGEDSRQSHAHSREERHRMTVDQQVDALIREATLFENQAAMFEGWMAWI